MRGRTKSEHFMRTGKKEGVMPLPSQFVLIYNVSIIRKKSWFEISRTINFLSFLFNWLVKIVKLCFVIGKCECFGPQYFGLWKKLGSNFFEWISLLQSVPIGTKISLVSISCWEINYHYQKLVIYPTINTQSCIKRLLVVWDFCFWAIWAAGTVLK